MYPLGDAQSVASATERRGAMAADSAATQHCGATERGETIATDGDASEHPYIRSVALARQHSICYVNPRVVDVCDSAISEICMSALGEVIHS